MKKAIWALLAKIDPLRKLWILCFAFPLILGAENQEARLPPGNMHLIIVADTVSNIAHASLVDFHRMRAEMQIAANYAGMGVIEKNLVGSDYSAEKVYRYLEELSIGPNDIVFFYYSGHGTRSKEMVSDWPLLHFSFFEELLDVYDVVNTLYQKGGRLTVVLADCCNQSLPGFTPTIKSFEKMAYSTYQVPTKKEGYRALFLQGTGLIIGAGSEPGELAFGCNEGGFYSIAFLESLKKELTSQTPNWDDLMQRATYYTHLIDEEQHPIHFVAP